MRVRSIDYAIASAGSSRLQPSKLLGSSSEGKDRKAVMSSSEEGAAVEGRAPRRCHGSPGQSGVSVTVVYYLCRSGRHLEHPHLMEMHLTSPNQALYLRDVIRRLDALRGKGMAAMYSWSCKRRYKTGFVWHDVLEDDLLLPAQGSEYVLKGSLLLPQHSSPPAFVATPPADHDCTNVGTTIIPRVHCVKPTTDEEAPTHSQEAWTANSSLSSPPTIKVEVEVKAPPPALHQEPQPELSPTSPSSSGTTGDRGEEAASARSSSSGSPSAPNKLTRVSAGSIGSPSGCTSSPTLPSLMLHNKQQVSVITDEATQTQGTSTGRDLHKKGTSCSTGSTPTKETVPTDDKQPGRTESFSYSTSRNRTLESLIRAEALGRRSTTAKRILEEEDDDDRAAQSIITKLNPANLLMRLMACGSTMSARQHLPACGIMRPTPKPQYLSQHVELLPSSPVLSPLGALIMRPVTAAGASVVSDSGDCSYCSGSMLQTAPKGCESGKVMSTSIKPPSSNEKYWYIVIAERICCSVSEKEASIQDLDNLEGRSKIISKTIKMAPCQQPTSGTLVTITTDVRHNNDEQESSNEASSKTLSRSTSKRTDPSSQSSRVVSFHDEKEKVVKIEERLASGARVVIQCAPLLKGTYASAKAM
ncbi:hypothetical protein HU200_047900 [Digitaria exilis]|uniref:SOSEKI DIX-like domain-containing protein n=1 Tax=Digitaria exilis TaxID=1010633 RepID=A0A835B798_9POAL|nr:hypothetical protein HU200_047900 [Digitaria exilis]